MRAERFGSYSIAATLAGTPSAMEPAPLRLRLDHGDVHAQDPDLEELLDRLPDLRRVRVGMDAERVRVVLLDLGVALLGNDRGEQDLVWMQTHRFASGG